MAELGRVRILADWSQVRAALSEAGREILLMGWRVQVSLMGQRRPFVGWNPRLEAVTDGR